MRCPIVQVCTVGRQRVPLPIECYRFQVWPNGHHNHISYGEIMMDAWKQFTGSKGMLWLEGDIAIDPTNLRELDEEISSHPDLVIAVPYILWPKSTLRARPCWSVRDIAADGSPIYHDSNEVCPYYPAFFSIGCTYLPSSLLNAVKLGVSGWDYPNLDTTLSKLARDNGITCVTAVNPAMHLHY